MGKYLKVEQNKNKLKKIRVPIHGHKIKTLLCRGHYYALGYFTKLRRQSQLFPHVRQLMIWNGSVYQFGEGRCTFCLLGNNVIDLRL